MVKTLHLAAIAVALFSVFGTIANAQEAVVSIDPFTQNVPIGSEFQVAVHVNNISNLYGYQFDLSYTPNITAVSVTEGSFLSKGGPTFFIPGVNDSIHSTVRAAADTLLGAVPGVSGAGTLAVFTFELNGPGGGNFYVQAATFLDSALNPIGAQLWGGNINAGISAPEMEPASAAAALTVLLGALAVWRGRPRKFG